MAEIRVVKEKRSLGWLWALLTLLVLALAAWWFFSRSAQSGPAPADTVAPRDTTIGMVLERPADGVLFAA